MFFPSSDLCRGLARPGREGRSLSDKIQMWLSLFDDKDGDKNHEDNHDRNMWIVIVCFKLPLLSLPNIRLFRVPRPVKAFT